MVIFVHWKASYYMNNLFAFLPYAALALLGQIKMHRAYWKKLK